MVAAANRAGALSIKGEKAHRTFDDVGFDLDVSIPDKAVTAILPR